MLINRFGAAEIVESLGHEAGLAAQLAQRCLHRRLAGLDGAVHRLPGAGTAPVVAAAQRQHLELPLVPTQCVGVHEGHANRSQRRRPSTASSRAESARARNGLVRKSSAPSSKTRTSLSSSPFAVSTMTGIFAVAGRGRRCESTP